MTPEQIAGCFLDYQKHFSTSLRKNLAETLLQRFLSAPNLSEDESQHTRDQSDAKHFKNFARMSDQDQDVMHSGYLDAAKAYQNADNKTRETVKALMLDPVKKSMLLEKAAPFLSPDAQKLEAQAKKATQEKHLDDLRAKAREDLKNKNTGPKVTSPSTAPFTSPQTSTTPVGSQEQSPKQETPKTSKPSSTFQTMFEHKTFKESYESYESLEKLSFAQKVHVHNHLREEQIQLLDLIEKALLSDQNPKANDADHAAIFYGVLNLMQKNLKHEFRWTELLGFPRKSRLESVIQDNIEQLSKNFPNIQTITDKKDLKDLLAKKGLEHIGKQVDTLLEPHGFLKAAKEFIKHGLDAFIPHKSKKP